jgi:hypothetical protein
MRISARRAGKVYRGMQEDSREGIRTAVRAYTELRGAPGHYGDTVTAATLRDGTPVTVTITLTITPQESPS